MRIEKLNKSFKVITDIGEEIGSFQLDSNGFYYFWEHPHLIGCWDSISLRDIADELDKINSGTRKANE